LLASLDEERHHQSRLLERTTREKLISVLLAMGKVLEIREFLPHNSSQPSLH
jgi:hypothetical protein